MSFTAEYIVSSIERNQYDTIAIFSGDGRRQIDYKHGTPSDCIDCFEIFDSGASGGNYQIHLYIDGKQSGNGAKQDANRKRILNYSKSNTDGGHFSPQNDMLARYLESRDEVNELKMKMALAEMETSKSDVGAKLFDLVLELSRNGKMQGGIQKAPQSVPQHTSELDDDIKEILGVLNEWQKSDPDFYDALRGVVKLSKEDPAKYAMAKKML